MEVELDPESEDSHAVPLMEHNYSKSPPKSLAEPRPDDNKEEESMDTNGESGSGGGGSPSLTKLDDQADTFESFLLCLLRAFTRQQQQRQDEVDSSHETTGSGAGAGALTSVGAEAAAADVTEISPEALSTLSSDQVTALVTSNSVNFDVIQQILSQKQRQQPKNSLLENENEPPEFPDEPETFPSEPAGGDVASPSPMPQVQVTPEQLKLLQAQVSELIRTQQISLPPDLTPEQQQQLIRTLLLRQLHVQQAASSKQAEGSEGKGSGHGGTILGLLKGDGGTAMDKGGNGKKEPVPLAAESPRPAYPATNIVKEESPPLSSEPVSSSTKTPSQQHPVLTVPSQPQPSSANPPHTTTTSSPPSLPPSQTAGSLTPAAQPSPNPTSSSSTAKSSTSSAAGSKRRRESTRGKKEKEKEEELKKPSMPYNLFFSEVYSTVLAANPKMTFADCSRIISMMWNAMGSDAKKRYYEEHEKQKEEYKAALDRKAAEQARAQQATVAQLSAETGASAKAEPMETSASMTAGPIPSTSEPKDPSLCVYVGCTNLAVTAEDRGKEFCSYECAVNHCKNVFQSWVAQRKVKS